MATLGNRDSASCSDSKTNPQAPSSEVTDNIADETEIKNVSKDENNEASTSASATTDGNGSPDKSTVQESTSDQAAVLPTEDTGTVDVNKLRTKWKPGTILNLPLAGIRAKIL